MKHIAAWAAAICLATALQAAQNKPAAPPIPAPPAQMTVDEAAANLAKPELMKDAAWRDAVVNVFTKLPPNQADAAVQKLKPLLATVPPQIHGTLVEAFLKLGDRSLPVLTEAVQQDAAAPAAVVALQRFGARAIMPVQPLLADPRAAVRLRAAGILATVLPNAVKDAGVQRTVPLPAVATALGERLKDESAAVALTCAKALAAMGRQALPAREALVAATGSPNPDLRAAAAAALGNAGDASAAPELVKMLADADSLIRLQAAQSAASLGEPAVPQLAEALKSSNALVRSTAAYALGRAGTKAAAAAPALTAALSDQDDRVRANVVEALARVSGPKAVAPLMKALSDPSALVRDCAARELEGVAKDDANAVAAAAKARKELLADAKPQVFEAPPYAFAKRDYMVGGPLEGVNLPKYATTHGEPAGFPGCIPALQKLEGEGEKQFTSFTSQACQPELQLYPGAVEHYRAYWMKYNAVRFTFDAESQVRNFLAKDLPGIAAGQITQYEEPVYWVPRHRDPRNTGMKNAPVPVVVCGPKSPVFQLDLGELPTGFYAVRVIGAVATKDLERIRKPLYIALSVNDGLRGEESQYKLRCGYCDEFYSITEIYFHAPEKRVYKARLWVAEGSQAQLLVHNITLDDALVGMALRPVKTRMTLMTPEEQVQVRADRIAARQKTGKNAKWTPPTPRPLEEQWARDAVLWAAWPRVNAQPGYTYGNQGVLEGARFGTGGGQTEKWGADQADVAAQWGVWTHTWSPNYFRGDAGLRELNATLNLLSNNKLRLDYTMADYAAGKPLPDPYPFKDDGTGLYFASKDPAGPAQLFNPVANGIHARIQLYKAEAANLAGQYAQVGDVAAGRDAALMLIRMAYDTPSIDAANSLSCLVANPGPMGRDLRNRRRETVAAWAPDPKTYDKLFDAIQGNEELARSVNRFIPWVKSSADVVTLCDAYLCQDSARRVMRYQHMTDNAPTLILTPTVLLADRDFTRPWLEWLWAKAYIYPNPTSGLPDMISTANDRDGAGYIGSWSYCQGEESSHNGDALAGYVAVGGDPKYDLRDAKRYPKVTDACYFPLQTSMAGLYWPRVGDVGGADKGYAMGFGGFDERMRRGWEWTKDPAFAWMIKNHFSRKGDSDAEWAAIEQAAAKVSRPPYMTQPSRVVSNWCAVLEGGQQYDDPRFRSAVMLRVGQGYGHAHQDTLDLQIMEHGYPFTIDDGQRAGYTSGSSASTKWHNMVMVDDKNWQGPSWVKSLSDAPGARYMLAAAGPEVQHPDVTSFRRQVALVEVDEGRGAAPVTPQAIQKGTDLPKDVVTPNSYVLDVVRVAGGQKHTYCFHGPIDDEFDANADQKAPSDKGKREGFPASEHGFTGVAPEVLTATWRMQRNPMGIAVCEKGMAPWFNPASPLKYTRLHLLGQKGAAVYTDWTFCKQWKYGFTDLYAAHETEAQSETVFPAIIEPYVGEPFISGLKLLPVADNDAGAGKAVVIEVKTKNGHTDLVFSDGSPEKTRAVGAASFSGEFALVSEDEQGLRLASVAGGTLLRTPLVTLKPARRERVAKILQVNYEEKSLVTDAPLGAFTGRESAIEIASGTRSTTYMITGVKPAGQGSVVSVRGGADLFASRVEEVDPKANTVACALPLPFSVGSDRAGVRRDGNLVASNASRTKFWRADFIGGAPGVGPFVFKLDGPVADKDFTGPQSFRVWEYGVGDTVRQATGATLQRIGSGLFVLISDVDVTLALKGSSLESSADGQTWKPVKAAASSGQVETAFTTADLGPAGHVYVRVK